MERQGYKMTSSESGTDDERDYYCDTHSNFCDKQINLRMLSPEKPNKPWAIGKHSYCWDGDHIQEEDRCVQGKRKHKFQTNSTIRIMSDESTIARLIRIREMVLDPECGSWNITRAVREKKAEITRGSERPRNNTEIQNQDIGERCKDVIQWVTKETASHRQAWSQVLRFGTETCSRKLRPARQTEDPKLDQTVQ